MSALYTNGAAKRLLCSACHRTQVPRVITSTERADSSFLGWEARGRRQYATKRLNPNARPVNPPSTRSSAPPSSPLPAGAPRTSTGNKVPSSNKEPARLLFSTQDIPPLQEWMNSLEGLGNKHLTPLQCVDGARRYVSVATQHESQWRPKLEKGRCLSPPPLSLFESNPARTVKTFPMCANTTSQNTISHLSCYTGSGFYLCPGTPRPGGVWVRTCYVLPQN